MHRECLEKNGERLLIVLLLFLAVASVVQGFVNGLNFIDFHWESAALFLRRLNPYQFALEGLTFDGVCIDATQAPSTIAFILPYGLFDHYMGNLLWDVSNLLFVAVFLWCVWKMWFMSASKLALFVSLLLLVGTPWRVCIGNGQHVMFSLMFFMLAYFEMERGRSKWLTGILLAAALFKYTVTAPMAFVFLFRREWRVVLICAGVHIVLTALLGWWTDCSPIVLVLQSLKVGGRLLGQGDADVASLLGWLGVDGVKTYALMGYVIGGLFLFVYSFTGKKDALLKLATMAVVANVMFYHRVYDFVTLIFPLVYVILHWKEKELLGRILRVLVVVNVVWTFFAVRAFAAVGWDCCRVPVTYVLEHLLLAALIVESYLAGGEQS